MKSRQPGEKRPEYIRENSQKGQATDWTEPLLKEEKVKAFVNKRQSSKVEIQLGQIIDSLAYKPLDDVVGGQKGIIN